MSNGTDDVVDEAMRRLDAFLDANTDLPNLAVASVLIQRAIEMSMEHGIPRKGFLQSIDELWKRLRKGQPARDVSSPVLPQVPLTPVEARALLDCDGERIQVGEEGQALARGRAKLTKIADGR